MHPLSVDWDALNGSQDAGPGPSEDMYLDLPRLWVLTLGLEECFFMPKLAFADAVEYFIEQMKHFVPACSVDAAAEAASACFYLASLRVGALIVCEPAPTHLGRGVDMNIRCCYEVLCLVFDPCAPTHDGAVVLCDGRLVACRAFRAASQELACEDVTRDISRGSRHYAAQCISYKLGLLVIVVSEERGTVCAAEAGSLSPYASPGELGQAFADLGLLLNSSIRVLIALTGISKHREHTVRMAWRQKWLLYRVGFRVQASG